MVRTTRLKLSGKPSLAKASDLANDLRARGFSPLIVGGPRAEKVQGVSVRDATTRNPLFRKTGFRSRRAPDFRFYSGAVLETLEAASKVTTDPGRVEALLVQAETGWAGGGRTFDVYWVPTWVAAVAHAGKIAVPALQSLVPVFAPTADAGKAATQLRVAAVLWLEAHADQRALFVEAFWGAVSELEGALSSAEMLGGAEAVDAILSEIGL